MKIQKIILIILIIITGFSACHTDYEDETIINGVTPKPTILTTKSGTIHGYVYSVDSSNNTNKPEPSVTVSLPTGETTQTNEYGVYTFKNAPLNPLGTYIKAESTEDNYFLGSDYVYPTKGVSYSYIQLIPAKQEDGTFTANQGGTIHTNGGGTIIFEPNTIKDAAGNDFQGEVFVHAKRLSTDDKKLEDKMPGALLATRSNGDAAVLSSFGMVAVLLFDNNKNPLNLKDNTTAKLISPITETQRNDAPEEIPTWYFDEEVGLWIEDGMAQKIGNNYEADVTHFSWWNYDAPFPVINLCVNIKYPDGTPIPNIEIQISSSLNSGRSGYTDSEGEICGQVAQNTPLTLTIVDPRCGDNGKTIEIGPFSTDVVLDDIFLEFENNSGFGTVFCNGTPVEDAVVVLNYSRNASSTTLLVAANENGHFEIDLNNIFCENFTNLEIFAYSTSTGEASPSLNVDLENPQTLNLNICTNCDFTININPTYDLVCTNEIAELTAISSVSGNYAYLWNTDETSETIIPSEAGTYCVTVTDVNAYCNSINCYELNDSSYFHVELFYNDPTCGLDNGSIGFEVWGGMPPYSFNWSNGNTNGYSTNLSAGIYSFTITDATGCSKILSATLENDNSFDLTLSDFTECDNVSINVYSQNQNINNATFNWEGPNGFTSTASNINENGLEGGEYCVTVTQGACTFSDCISVFAEIATPPQITSCNNNFYTLVNINNSPIYITSLLPNIFTQITLEPGDATEINVFDFGYLYNIEGNCFFEEQSFPHYTGSIFQSKTNTTCSTCNDGSITFVNSLNATCQDCTVGTTAVYEITNLDTDLSDLNNMQQLTAGTYFIVLKNQSTGCWIKHEKVTIE